MDFVDEQNAVGVFLQLLQDGLQALFEVAAIFGPGQQGAHVERIHDSVLQYFRHFALHHTPGQAFGDGSLAHAGFADEQGVVLAAAAQRLDDAFDFGFAPDQRIDLAFGCELVQVLRELVERAFLLLAFGLAVLGALGRLLRFGLLVLAHAVRDEVDHVQARHALLVQVIHGVRILLAEDGDEHVGAGDFLLAVRCRLHVHDGTLDHALEAQRRLRIDFGRAGYGRGVVADEVRQRFAQIIDIHGAGAHHLRCRRVVQQREQQVLDGDEFMARLPSFDKRHVQTDFQFLRNHTSSITHCRGWPALRAWANTNSTFVDAISFG